MEVESRALLWTLPEPATRSAMVVYRDLGSPPAAVHTVLRSLKQSNYKVWIWALRPSDIYAAEKSVVWRWCEFRRHTAAQRHLAERPLNRRTTELLWLSCSGWVAATRSSNDSRCVMFQIADVLLHLRPAGLFTLDTGLDLVTQPFSFDDALGSVQCLEELRGNPIDY